MNVRVATQSVAASWLAVAGVALAASACGSGRPPASDADTAPAETAPSIRELDPPAATGAFAPRLVATDDELLLTWWQPAGGAEGEPVSGHRLMFSRHDDRTWSAPSVVVEGEDFFANWADVPAVIREPSGSLLAHWLVKTAPATFAYSIELSRSTDDGATWSRIGRLNDDATDTEHGFVSLVVEGDAVRAYWLDGRLMADDGPMTVRSARIGATVGTSELLDDRVCECCPTAAVATPAGSVVVYRDRAADETREIYAVHRAARGEGSEWSAPEPVTADGWRIPGCPVNGPAIDHRDGVTAMAWFTAREGAPRVAARFGLEPVSVAVPLVVDDAQPLGRVGLALDGDGTAVVSWLAVAGSEAEVRLRRVASSGAAGAPLVLGRTSGSRASGVPQLARRDGAFYAAWVEVGEGIGSHLRVREIPAALVPPA